MGALAIPIAIGVSAAVAAGGAAYSGVQQADAADYNAKVARRQAQWETMRSQAEADRLAEQDKKALASQRARLAASGRDPADASPLMIMTESAAAADADYRSILQGGQMASSNLRSQASAYKSQGTAASVGAGLGATSALANGAANIYGYQDQVAYRQAQLDAYTGGRGIAAPSGVSDPWGWR